MATAGSLLTNIRKILGDPDRDFVDDTTGLDWLDRAQRRFCHVVMPLDEYKNYSVSSKVTKYDLPTNCIIPINVMWYQSRTRKLEYVPPDVWGRMEEAFPNATGTPENYTILQRKLVVGPQVPQTAAATSTASGLMNETVTTLNLTAASGTFRSKGYVLIGSEVMEYSGVATTTLTGVTRGIDGTTAASHASNATVIQIDLRMLYRKDPMALSASTSVPEIPDSFVDYLEKYAIYLGWLARGDANKAEAALNEFEKFETESKKTAGRRALDGLLRIQDKVRRNW